MLVLVDRSLVAGGGGPDQGPTPLDVGPTPLDADLTQGVLLEVSKEAEDN